MNRPEKNPKTSPWEESFVIGLYQLLQAARIHKDNNELVKAGLVNFKHLMSQVEFADEFTMVVSEGRFYIRGERLQYRKDLV